MTKQNQYFLQSRPHPGVILSEKWKETGMTYRELAERIGISEKTINAVINGNASITAELAVKLESVTQISAHFWLKSQWNYDYFMERKDYVPMVSLDWNKHYTYADCLSWAEGFRCEIINGVARELPPVYAAHARVSSNLMFHIYSYVKSAGYKCKVYGGIFDVRLPKSGETAHDKIDTVVQPDLCIIFDSSKIDEYGCCGTPDMIVEILSPATLKNDCIRKFLLYEEHGVREYWMVHPNDKAVTVFLLQKNGRFSDGALYEFKGKVPIHVLDNYLMDLDDIFRK